MCIAKDILSGIRGEIDTAKNERDRLRQELSTSDKAICDILHNLEFTKSLSASQGYKYAKMLKNLRKNRRFIKNELEELQILLDKFSDLDLHKLDKSLINLENRQKERLYTPRVLTSEKAQMMLNII